jgi:SAM-dependent methyltransferase
MSSPQAFDTLAPTYDADFTASPIARYLRGLVHGRLLHYFHAGDHVLELGCGTGEDALFLAQRGIRVTATDSSDAMLHAARAKSAGHPLIQVARLDMSQLPATGFQSLARIEYSVLSTQSSSLPPTDHQPPAASHFSAAFSNFGPVNCLNEWKSLAAWLSKRLVPGGIIGLGVMSPLCLWEPLWHGLHGEWAIARRRWKRDGTAFNPAGRDSDLQIYYPTIQRLKHDFSVWFECVYVRPLGVFLPPSDVYGAIEKRPTLLRLLMGFERRFGGWAALAPFADHYWIEFKLKPDQ